MQFLKTAVKSVLEKAAPRYYAALMTKRVNRHGWQVLKAQGVPEIAAALVARHGSKILGGPFAGMEYIDQSIGSSLIPKLVGSYECELDEPLARILSTEYAGVIDVGSAEGYYAVGLAMRLPGNPAIFAYDIDPHAQDLCRQMAQANGVASKVVIGAGCDPHELQTRLAALQIGAASKKSSRKTLVLCDCEGYERELLDPAAAPALAQSEILVELHDILKPGITPILQKRFAASHEIQFFDTKERDPADYPVLAFLTPEQQRVAVTEFRLGPQQWAFLTPKAANA